MLNLNLYDTTGDEDIFINQVLVDTGIAVFLENPEEQAGERFLAHFCKRIVQVFFSLLFHLVVWFFVTLVTWCNLHLTI